MVVPFNGIYVIIHEGTDITSTHTKLVPWRSNFERARTQSIFFVDIRIPVPAKSERAALV